MHLVDGPNTGPGNTFLARDVVAGVPGTLIAHDWLNAIQAELKAAIEASGQTLSKPNTSQLLAAILALSRPSMLRNALLNGDFRFNRRATATNWVLPANSTQYIHERWYTDVGASPGTQTILSQAFSLAQTEIPDAPNRWLDYRQTAGAGAARQPSLAQRLERIEYYSGRKWVSSAWMKVSSGTLTVQPRVRQVFGSGGSADVIANGTNWTVTTAWQRFQSVIDVPSTSGKTFGTGNKYLSVEWMFPTGTTFQLGISRPQFELGAFATPFDRLPESFEHALLSRYYETSYQPSLDDASFVGDLVGAIIGKGSCKGFDAGTEAGTLNTRFMTAKRATPAMTWYSPVTGAAGKIVWNGADQTVVSTVNGSNVATGWPSVTPTITASQCAAHWTADAEL